MNLYGFAGGDPINFSDPFGLCPPAWLCDWITLVASQMARPNAVPATREFVASFGLGSGLGWNGSCQGPGCKMGQFFGLAGMVLPTSQLHHIATNKNWISPRGGGPWSPKFAELFEPAGMSLDDALNKIAVAGHRGPHPAYNQAVYDRLVSAVEGLQGDAYSAALRSELNAIRRESATRGTKLNGLAYRKTPIGGKVQRYFRVLDAVDLPGRWYLRGPRDSHGREIDARHFTNGQRATVAGRLVIPVRHPGHPLDFTFGPFDMPVVRDGLGDLFASFAANEIQRVPAKIDGVETETAFEILNVIRTIACVDEQRSDVMYWTDHDGRPDKIGQFRMINKLRLDLDRVDGEHVFRIDGWKIALVVSDQLRRELLANETTGIHFAV